MKTSKQNQVGNFEKLVSFTNAQGAVYNPGKASIKSAALQTLLTQAQGAIQAANVSRTAYVNAVNAREPVMVMLPKLATRIIGALQASGVSAQTLEDCKSIKRRFHKHGRKPETSSPVLAGNPPSLPNNGATTPRHRSVSQSDIDSLIGNFQQLVTMTTSDPNYKPNEAELQLAGLNAFITNLRDKNKAVIAAKVAMNEANRTLNNMLYSTTGIYGQAIATKGYIKSLFGFESGKYKEVATIKFQNK